MTAKKYRAWNTGDLNVLITMHESGHSSELIADKLKRTTSAINAKKEYLRGCGRISGRINHWTNHQVKTAIELHNNGYTHQAIGEVIHRTRCSVSNMIKRLTVQGKI